MSREIKFRAWDGNRIIHSSSVMDMMFSDGNYYDHMPWKNDKVEVEIMQFTGLKDKNKNPIWEGDILRVPPKTKWEETNYSSFEVFWHDNDCADNHIGFQMNRMHNYGSVAGGFCGHKFLPGTVNKFEVIGNIYEHKHLLTPNTL